jgi:hypothetical protein
VLLNAVGRHRLYSLRKTFGGESGGVLALFYFWILWTISPDDGRPPGEVNPVPDTTTAVPDVPDT